MASYFLFVLARPFNGVSIWADGCTFPRGPGGPQPRWHSDSGLEGVIADYRAMLSHLGGGRWQ